MDGGDRLVRRRSLQGRLGLVCCGTTNWGIGPSTMSIQGDVDELLEPTDSIRILPEHNSDPNCVSPSPRMNLAAALAAELLDPTDTIRILPESNSDPECAPRMNLAAALAAERQTRSTDVAVDSLTPVNENEDDRNVAPAATPARVSLMRLLEETDDQDEKGVDQVCGVCMGRKKGAAFIPCGHTFCRVCSRELWLNRGSCPLCNRSILEILDIF